MPNPINRRRLTGPSESSAAEIAVLKEQLESLKQLYLNDMANVSNDMRMLNDQITQSVLPTVDSTPVEVVAVDTPLTNTQEPLGVADPTTVPEQPAP